MFFDRGTFWVLPLTYFCLPKSARAYLFVTQSVKIWLLLQRPHQCRPHLSATKPHKDVIEHLIEYKDVKLHFDALWAEMERREPEATRELTSERSFKSPDSLRQVNARNEKVKSYEEL